MIKNLLICCYHNILLDCLLDRLLTDSMIFLYYDYQNLITYFSCHQIVSKNSKLPVNKHTQAEINFYFPSGDMCHVLLLNNGTICLHCLQMNHQGIMMSMPICNLIAYLYIHGNWLKKTNMQKKIQYQQTKIIPWMETNYNIVRRSFYYLN